jgi:hypothetical protein
MGQEAAVSPDDYDLIKGPGVRPDPSAAGRAPDGLSTAFRPRDLIEFSLAEQVLAL